jgi:UDP-N-acetylmuramoylalanine--D-glutamate ligase
MGLGKFGGGVAAARFLAQNGAEVTISDSRPESDLRDSLATLSDVPIRKMEFGGHTPAAFEQCGILVVNPAVKPNQPEVEAARHRGTDVTTEIALFLRHNPAPVIAVSGSNGKSTTTALIHHLLSQDIQSVPIDQQIARRVWLGGNIGISLLNHVQEMTAEDLVVLELSSFQLHLLRNEQFRPRVAVLTNFSANHLDWHGTVAEYRTAKQVLFDAQLSNDTAITPTAIHGVDPWRVRGQHLEFGNEDTGNDGAFLADGTLLLRAERGGLEDCIRITQPHQLPGAHNALNVAAAACAAWQCGADPFRFSESLHSFRPLPHRLQQTCEKAGRQFWNDSIATTPESAIMALRVFANRCVLLAGGYDKGQDLSAFAAEIRRSAKAVVLMGQTGASLLKMIQSGHSNNAGNADCSSNPECCIARDFRDAFQQAVELSQPGDIVLLSPGCASYDWFRDYRERGDLFTRMAQEWKPTECSPEQ